MFSPPLISQLFTRDLQKYIIQGGHFREYSSEWNVLALKIIQDPDQVMLRSCTPDCQDLALIMYVKNMLQFPDFFKIVFFQEHRFDGNSFACFDP